MKVWQVGAAITFILGLGFVLALPVLSERNTGTPAGDRSEPTPHWEYDVTVRSSFEEGEKGMHAEALERWVGSIPYDGPGSICRLISIGADGAVVGRGDHFYAPVPRSEDERTGGAMGQPVPASTTDAEVRCRPLTTSFEVADDPEIHFQGGRHPVAIGTATLEWDGPKLLGESFWCDVWLYDEQGDLIRKSVAGPNPGFWPPGDFKGPPPYEVPVHFLFQLMQDAPEPVDADIECSLDQPTVD